MLPSSQCQSCYSHFPILPSRCSLPDAPFPMPNLLPPLPDASTQPQIAITQWPFASSRLPLHDNQRTKTSILCSKCPKTRVPKAKSAQKPRFCARNARKRGFPTSKAHKNPDFVLEMPENKGSQPQKRTKTSILCSKSLKTGVPDPKKAQKPRFCARIARKRGFRSPKKHKNPDFVLGKGGRRAWV